MADGGFSVGEDGWLNISVKITLISHWAFRSTLPPILRELPTIRLPRIDSRTRVLHQSTIRFLRNVVTLNRHMADGVGPIDKIDHCYRLTTNKWFARYEVRDLMSSSDYGDGMCSYSCLCNDPSWNRRPDRSGQTRSRWKADYGAKKTFFHSSDDVACSRCIGVKRDKDGYLTACLSSKNETRVEVQFGFKLTNCDGDVHSESTGKGERFWTVFEAEQCLIGSLHEFSFIDDCCEDTLLLCTEIASPDNGFLEDGYFLVRLDMRVKQKDNEVCEATVDGKTATIQVSFPYASTYCLPPELEFSGSGDS